MKSQTQLNALVVERDELAARSIAVAIEKYGHTAHTVRLPEHARDALAERFYDVVIAEHDEPAVDGLALLRYVRRQAPNTRAVLTAASASIQAAVEATKSQADYVVKPPKADILEQIFDAVAELREAERASAAERSDGSFPTPLVGKSPAMMQLKQTVDVVANNDGAVLVCGESGTGKELVARMVHVMSPRRAGQFVAVNCAAFPDTLLDAELFGHERGAFTGANARREGRFEAADGGTLFLDEIGEMPPTAQAKLLRVLEQKTFQRLGSNETRRADVRVVSATNRDLEKMVRDGSFREDLYYRIKLFRINVPALRDRPGDIPVLANHFCRRYAKPGAPPPRLSPSARAVLAAYEFRGNVRELQHAIRHAIAFSNGGEILVEHLPEELVGSGTNVSRAPTATSNGGGVIPLTNALTEFEHEYLLQALEYTDGNRARAASLLGISRKSLWAKLKRYREQPPTLSAVSS